MLHAIWEVQRSTSRRWRGRARITKDSYERQKQSVWKPSSRLDLLRRPRRRARNLLHGYRPGVSVVLRRTRERANLPVCAAEPTRCPPLLCGHNRIQSRFPSLLGSIDGGKPGTRVACWESSAVLAPSHCSRCGLVLQASRSMGDCRALALGSATVGRKNAFVLRQVVFPR